jgi:23S rRNA (adenine2503-C2)-methyltransferase
MTALFALQAVTPEELSALVPPMTVAEARKVVAAVHRGEATDGPVGGVRRVVLSLLRAASHTPTLEVAREESSALDPFQKIALRTHDGHLIETVRIPLERAGRFSVCVSSQVGCALGCRFCATGRMGLVRNLEAWEIVEQVRLVRRTLPPGGRIHGVVFQGMGEPMANLDRVLQAIRVMNDPCALAIDARNITVTTSGLPAGIRRLSLEAKKVRLGLSISSARQPTRRSLMPIADAHGIEEVYAACVQHAHITGLSPLWAVTPLSGVNDTEEDAQALALLLLRFAADTGRRPRLTVVPYNNIGGDDPYRRQTPAEETRFRDRLATLGTPPKKRYSGGSDIQAACGQLAGRE